MEGVVFLCKDDLPSPELPPTPEADTDVTSLMTWWQRHVAWVEGSLSLPLLKDIVSRSVTFSRHTASRPGHGQGWGWRGGGGLVKNAAGRAIWSFSLVVVSALKKNVYAPKCACFVLSI